MLRLSLVILLVGVCTGAAHAAECTKSLQVRWEEAMAEAMQISRMLLRIRGNEPDRPTLCRVLKNATELSTIGKEYFLACDPLNDDGRRVVLLRMEQKLAMIDPSVCTKPAKAGPGKKA